MDKSEKLIPIHSHNFPTMLSGDSSKQLLNIHIDFLNLEVQANGLNYTSFEHIQFLLKLCRVLDHKIEIVTDLLNCR